MMPQINKSVNPEIGKLRKYFTALLLGNMTLAGAFRCHCHQTEFSTAELTATVESKRQLTKFYIAELKAENHTPGATPNFLQLSYGCPGRFLLLTAAHRRVGTCAHAFRASHIQLPLRSRRRVVHSGYRLPESPPPRQPMHQSNVDSHKKDFSLQQISKTDTIRLSEKFSKFETF